MIKIAKNNYIKATSSFFIILFLILYLFPYYVFAQSKTAYNINLLAKTGETIVLPESTYVKQGDGTVAPENITWSINKTITNLQQGERVVSGVTKNTKQSIKATIHVNNTFSLAAVGDSVTYGLGLSNRNEYAYPAQLNSRLGTDYTVTNYGYSGATLMKSGNKPYTNTTQYQQSLVSNANVVIIQLGANDSKILNYRYISQFVSDYKALITQYQNMSSKPFIYVALPPKTFNNRTTIVEENLVNIRKLIAEMVLEYDNVSLIDNFSVTQDLSSHFSDGLHPDEKGTAYIANNIYANLKGESSISNGQNLASEYDTSSGLVNNTADGVFQLEQINTQDWIKFKNVNLNSVSNKIQFLLAIPYNNIEVSIRVDSLNGTILANTTLTSSGNTFTSWLSQDVPINKGNLSGTHDVYMTFSKPVTLKATEIMRIRSINFTPTTARPILIQTPEQLEQAFQTKVKNVTLAKDITLKKILTIHSETVLNLNQYTLDTSNFYITKNENIAQRINLSIKNGSVKGSNKYGSIYTKDATTVTDGFNIDVQDINFSGILFIYNNFLDSWIRFSGYNDIKSTSGSNIYARNVIFEKNCRYYGSTVGGGSSDKSGSTVISLGGGVNAADVIVETGAQVELTPGVRGSGYKQNAISNFSTLTVKDNASLKARGEQPMLRTEYKLSNGAQVTVGKNATFDMASTNTKLGFSYSYQIHYLFDGAKFVSLESSASKKTFMYAYQASDITVKNNKTVKAWENDLQNLKSPTKQWNDIKYISMNSILSANKMGTISSQPASFASQFGLWNDYSKVQFGK